MARKLSTRAVIAGLAAYLVVAFVPLALATRWWDWGIYHHLSIEHFPLVVRVAIYSAPLIAGLVTAFVAPDRRGRHAVVVGGLCIVALGTTEALIRSTKGYPSPSPLQVLWYTSPFPLVLVGALVARLLDRRAA